jgi:hypothetical protein
LKPHKRGARRVDVELYPTKAGKYVSGKKLYGSGGTWVLQYLSKKIRNFRFKRRTERMNNDTIRRNFKRLLEHLSTTELGGQSQSNSKLTLKLDASYLDVLTRMKILEGTSKTELVRRALDAYAATFPEEALYPALAE